MFQMDESTFAQMQKSCCWFTLPIFEPVPDVDPAQNITEEPFWQKDPLVQRHIFAMIFGGFGYGVDLSKAKSTAMKKLMELEKSEPQDHSPKNPEFVKWIGLYAQYTILCGTALAYQKDYLLAAAYFMKGLQTHAINLFLPYCDFIKHILSKVESLPAELAEYEGCGFSIDEPMGSIDPIYVAKREGFLIASVAETVIRALKGENGEIILTHRGGQRYGSVRRLGSRNCIDIYEVLMVDRHFQLKKLQLYFNGYFTRENRFKLKLPKGFYLDPLSDAAECYNNIQ